MLARSQAIEALKTEKFDVVVIGGGITGAGVALDAASRGYSVALVERNDYAFGTSSRSSKLVHGGLRYLENFDIGLVREALLERQILVSLAPHLVKPLPLIVPAFEGKRLDRVLGLGLNAYDVMAIDRRSARKRGRDTRRSLVVEDTYWSPDRHRIISGEEVAEHLPALAGREPTSGYLFYDCQTDDVRLVLTVLGEAARFGAISANRVSVQDLTEENGMTRGVSVRDEISGEEFTIGADNVVNATGVWADRIKPGELYDEAEVPNIRPARGTHILFSYQDLPLKSGTVVPVSDGRRLFALPWLGHTLIGTTDNDYEGDISHVKPSHDDVEYILDAINAFFVSDLSERDIVGAYAGVRPLIAPADSKKSVDISRKEELYETSSGMVTITGGKLTTWRHMAKITVDRLVQREGRVAPCRTEEIPLGFAIEASELNRREGIPEETYNLLAGRYGYAAHDVLRLADEAPALAEPIVPGTPDLMAEVVQAAREEQALSITDIILRRTRLGLLAAREVSDPDSTVPQRVADVLANELGWDEQAKEQAIVQFREDVAAEGIVVSV